MEEAWVEHIIRLAHLPLTEEEKNTLPFQLQRIRQFMDQIQEVSGKGKEVPQNITPLRKDQPQPPSTNPETLLRQAPEKKEHFILVPPVLDESVNP